VSLLFDLRRYSIYGENKSNLWFPQDESGGEIEGPTDLLQFERGRSSHIDQRRGA
jgi:hypothetical protein